MAQYNTVFHTSAKILPRHEINRLDRKYGHGLGLVPSVPLLLRADASYIVNLENRKPYF